MIEQFKQAIKSIKEYWGKLDPKKKKLFKIISGATLALILVATVALNLTKEKFVVLYNNMSQEESREVYSQLRGMGVELRESETGELMVPESREDEILLTLAERGYPKSTTSYGIDTQNSLTTTDYERKENTKLQLQEKISETIRHMTGVKSATVILNVAQDNALAWDQSTQESSASVTIEMIPGYKLSPDNVTTVKNLVSKSVKNMAAADVAVIDASTMMEMQGRDELGETTAWDQIERLGFETQIETKYERKVKNLLSNAYGADGVTVSAKVVIDYDKMITESVEYIPDTNGTGVVEHIKDDYSMEPSDVAGGVAGEENNTDIPVVVDTDDDGIPEYVDHLREVDYVVSYIKKQIEKDSAPIKESTISVTVRDPDLSEEKKEALIDSISKAVNIAPTNIAVYSFVGAEDAPVSNVGIMESIKNIPLVYIIGGLMLLAIIIILIIVIASRSKKKEEELEEDEALEQASEPIEDLEEQRRKMKEIAERNANSKENAIAEEVREFSVENPEITAALIRSWLKEES